MYHWSKACGRRQENYCYAHFFLVGQTRLSGRETHTLLPWCTNNYRTTVVSQVLSIQHCSSLVEHSTISPYIVSVSIRSIKARPKSGSGANTPVHTASHTPPLV